MRRRIRERAPVPAQPPSLTLEAWVRLDEAQPYCKLVYKSEANEPRGYALEMPGNDMKPIFVIGDGSRHRIV